MKSLLWVTHEVLGGEGVLRLGVNLPAFFGD